MANSKLHDDLVNEIESLESPEDSVKALIGALADRIESCADNKVKLTDLKTVLREDPDAIAKAVLANTPAAKNKTRTTSGFDAPSTAFAKPVEGAREGMVGASGNDHRDQQFPENSNTEAERERIRRDNIAVQQGKQVVVNEDISSQVESDKRAEEDRQRAMKEAADQKAAREKQMANPA